MKKEKTLLQTPAQKIITAVQNRKKELTNKSFSGQRVYVHHEDESHYIFYNSFYEEFLIPCIHQDGSEYNLSYYVVFSKEIEPQIFLSGVLECIFMYGDERENTWEKTKAYRPRLIHKKATDYLKKQGRELSYQDFNYETVAVIRMANVYMSLNWAMVEETEDTYYVFTEHNGCYAIPKKIGNVTVSKWTPK